MNNTPEIRLTVAEFSAFVSAGGAADHLLESTLGAPLGQARGLKGVGALWLSIRLDAMPDVERDAYSQALKQSIQGLHTCSQIVCWVPLNTQERRIFGFFGKGGATVVSLQDAGLLGIIGTDTSAAISHLERVVTRSTASRFVVTVKDMGGLDFGIAWQDEVLAVREDNVWTELQDVPRRVAAKRIAQDLAPIVDGQKAAYLGVALSEQD